MNKQSITNESLILEARKNQAAAVFLVRHHARMVRNYEPFTDGSQAAMYRYHRGCRDTAAIMLHTITHRVSL